MAAHPEVQRAGVSALKRAGAEVLRRFGRTPVADEIGSDAPRDEGAYLREAVDALPTRIELAEAITAMDMRNEQRFASLRRWLVGALATQALILGGFVYFT